MTVAMFSGGACSYLAAKRSNADVLLFCDTGAEHRDLYRFVRESAESLGKRLIWLKSESIFELMRRELFIANNQHPLCSRKLKVQPAQKWINEHCFDADIVIGLDWSEPHRFGKVTKLWEDPESLFCRRVSFPMADAPHLTKYQMLKEIRADGLAPCSMYAEGYYHANCRGACARAGQAQWAFVYKSDREVYELWSECEHYVSDKRGYRCTVLKNRQKRSDTQPLELDAPMFLSEFSLRIERGDYDKYEYGGCGCFSEEAA